MHLFISTYVIIGPPFFGNVCRRSKKSSLLFEFSSLLRQEHAYHVWYHEQTRLGENLSLGCDSPGRLDEKYLNDK